MKKKKRAAVCRTFCIFYNSMGGEKRGEKRGRGVWYEEKRNDDVKVYKQKSIESNTEYEYVWVNRHNNLYVFELLN